MALALPGVAAPHDPIIIDLQVLPSVLAFLLVGMTPIGSIGFLLMAAERHRRDLQYRLEHDHLTGVSTRQAFERAAAEALRARGDCNQVHALLLADLDHVKRINDDHGHAAGDAALRAFVDHTRALLREQDLFGRYGGEEFVLLLPGLDTAGAAAVAERIRRVTAALALNAPPGGSVPLSVSVGLCTTVQIAPAPRGLPLPQRPSSLARSGRRALKRCRARSARKHAPRKRRGSASAGVASTRSSMGPRISCSSRPARISERYQS
jgi:diguanylate cyclase (GGDEF)-like protein